MSVKKQRRLLPRCSGVTSDNSQCGRRVADGSNPPLCHIHAAMARGEAASALTDTDVDEIAILKRLARSSNEQIKLRAVDLLLEVKRKQKATDDERQLVAGPTARQFLDALTADEREQVRALVRQLREIQRGVYERQPKLRPPMWAPEDSTISAADLVPAPAPVEDPAPPSRAEHTTDAPITEAEDEGDYLVIE